MRTVLAIIACGESQISNRELGLFLRGFLYGMMLAWFLVSVARAYKWL